MGVVSVPTGDGGVPGLGKEQGKKEGAFLVSIFSVYCMTVQHAGVL